MVRFNENNEVITEEDYRALLVGLQRREDISYSMEELETLHNFDETVSYHGAEMKICSDCSYSIVTP